MAKTLSLPTSWKRMAFNQQQYYLVDTHQSKNLSEAAKVITKMTNDRIRSEVRAILYPKLWYADR